MSKDKNCNKCGRINYCNKQYKDGCIIEREWIPIAKPFRMEDIINKIDIWGIGLEKKIDKRTSVIEKFAESATINELSYFTQMLEKSKLLDKILTILNQFDSLTAREFGYLTGSDIKSVYTLLNKLFDLNIVVYEVSKGDKINAYKEVKKWSYIS